MLLKELNALLGKHRTELGIPAFRSEISMSGSNQHWLQKNLKKNPNCPPRIIELLSKSISELTHP